MLRDVVDIFCFLHENLVNCKPRRHTSRLFPPQYELVTGWWRDVMLRDITGIFSSLYLSSVYCNPTRHTSRLSFSSLVRACGACVGGGERQRGERRGTSDGPERPRAGLPQNATRDADHGGGWPAPPQDHTDGRSFVLSSSLPSLSSLYLGMGWRLPSLLIFNCVTLLTGDEFFFLRFSALSTTQWRLE